MKLPNIKKVVNEEQQGLHKLMFLKHRMRERQIWRQRNLETNPNKKVKWLITDNWSFDKLPLRDNFKDEASPWKYSKKAAYGQSFVLDNSQVWKEELYELTLDIIFGRNYPLVNKGLGRSKHVSIKLQEHISC